MSRQKSLGCRAGCSDSRSAYFDKRADLCICMAFWLHGREKKILHTSIFTKTKKKYNNSGELQDKSKKLY